MRTDENEYPFMIQPPTGTPSLWFVDNEKAYRLDSSDYNDMSDREAAIAKALMQVALDRELQRSLGIESARP